MTDLHSLLDALRPLGWRESGPSPGLYLPPEHGGPMWIRPDGPGRVTVQGTSTRMGGDAPLKGMRLDDTERYVRKLMRSDRPAAAARGGGAVKVQALLVLADLSSEGAPEMTVLVEGDVTPCPGLAGGAQFGPSFRAIAAVWGRLEEGVGLERGEGGQAAIERAQDLVDAKDNAWRVMEALSAAYDRRAEKR